MTLKNLWIISTIILFLSSCFQGSNGTDGENGIDGDNGINGTDGKDGSSFNWLGELSSFPQNPNQYDAFLNTSNGNSYIYSNNKWEIFSYGPQLVNVVVDSMIDARDNKKYKIVTIGSQTWMASNLDFKTESSKCFANDTNNCLKYGTMYQWKDALGDAVFYNGDPSTIRGICPDGWHIPSIGEWYRLIGVTGSQNTVYLRSTYGWYERGYDRYQMNILSSGSYVNGLPQKTTYLDSASFSYRDTIIESSPIESSGITSFWVTDDPSSFETVYDYQTEMRASLFGIVWWNGQDDYSYNSMLVNRNNHNYIRCVKDN